MSRRSSDEAKRRLLLLLSYLGFVSLGLPDTVLGAAWPALRDELALPLDRAGALLLVTTVGVVLSSSASGLVRARWGTGAVLVASTWLAAGALALTAFAGDMAQLLGAALLAGLGGGAIDASLNHHVARHHGARHLTWLHACWGVGAASAPLLVAGLLARGTSWRVAYGTLAAVEAVLSLAFLSRAKLFGDRAIEAASAPSDHDRSARAGQIASVLLFYVYGGLEAGAGLWISSLLLQTRATSRALAGGTVALYWGALTVGRVLVGLRADALGPERILRAAPYLALVSCVALAPASTPTWFAALALVGLGLALAPIYPLAMHDTALRFGASDGARLVGYQVAAASLGVATLPWLLGAMARTATLSSLPLMLVALGLALLLLERARRQ